MASDCRDRYRNHIEYKETRVVGTCFTRLFWMLGLLAVYVGPWTKEEEDILTQIVTEMTVSQGKDMDKRRLSGASSASGWEISVADSSVASNGMTSQALCVVQCCLLLYKNSRTDSLSKH